MPFMISNVGISNMNLFIPTMTGTFSSTIQTYGIPGFRVLGGVLGYGHQLSPNASAGIGYHVEGISIGEHTSGVWNMALSIGGLYGSGELNLMGIYLEQPLSVSNRKVFRSLENSSLHIGFRREIHASTWVLIESSFDAHHSSLKVLLHTVFGNQYHLMVGYCSFPSRFSLGISIPIKSMLLPFTLTYNPLVGFTPAIQIYQSF